MGTGRAATATQRDSDLVNGRSRRIFYAAYLVQGSTGVQRMRALQSLGHTCVPFDLQPYVQGLGRIARALVYRLQWGPSVARLNRDLRAAVRGQSYDLVWIDKGLWLNAATIRALAELTGAPVVHFTADPLFAIRRHMTRQIMGALPHYAAMITTKSFEVEEYRRHGVAHVIFTQQGYDPDLFRPVTLDEREQRAFGSDVCFIGRNERHYVDMVRAAADVTPRVAVWGPWQSWLADEPWLAAAYRGPGVWEEDYVRALCGAKIALGLLSTMAGDQTTTRTFEIPACGTLMLAERTDEHRALFEEDREAVFFDGPDELRDKLRHYLADDAARQRIAAAGRARCQASGYSYADRLRGVLAELETRGVLAP